MDKNILNLNPKVSKGWQSHGILRFLGLDAAFKNIFSGWTIDHAIKALNSESQDFALVVEHLALLNEEAALSLADLQKRENESLKSASADSSDVRKQRLANYSGRPKRIQVIAYTYFRNADVTAEALHRANGICEICRHPAPFARDSDGTPYLEIHHVIPLHEGGPDDLSNVVAVCPNCHREQHFGRKLVR